LDGAGRCADYDALGKGHLRAHEKCPTRNKNYKEETQYQQSQTLYTDRKKTSPILAIKPATIQQKNVDMRGKWRE